jgi:CHAD domain-containing protein
VNSGDPSTEPNPQPGSPSSVSGTISALARKRLEKFAGLISRLIVTDDPETIHDVRVSSRRLQQVLGILASGGAKKNKRRKLARILRTIRRNLGRPRNLDVMNELVGEKISAASNPVVRDSWEQLRTYIADRRARAIERHREKLRDFDLVNFADRARAIIEGADEAAEGSLIKGVTGALADWRAAIASAKSEPGATEMHAVRIAGKRLRYRLELLAELGSVQAKASIKSVRVLQDRLGAWHDRQLLLETCAVFLSKREVLATHPALARVLLVEMEREQRRAKAAVDGLIKHMDKTARAFDQIDDSLTQNEMAAPTAAEVDN